MTGAARSTRGAVHWLTAEAVVFGAMAALLGVVANALFLDAYGSGWLPVTYIAVAAAGIVVSGAVARVAQRFDVQRIELAILGGAAVGLGASWVVARVGGTWVSVPMLVLFPILIQLGFVFVGGQAGRLLDIAQIKAQFPRIVAGFPAGAVLGSVLAGQLVAVLGRTEDLVLAAALCQAAFAALVWTTGRRYAGVLGGSGPGLAPGRSAEAVDDRADRPSLRTSLGGRFVQLILAYQVLSAVGSQLADFLVFDRASALYPDPEDLAGFLSGYTAVMNVASIGFLFLVAGPLLRRFGLRLGILANPAVLTVFALAMIAIGGVSGGASFALLAVVSAARIADIALTDGTTRTSINATYQVLPVAARLPVQASVEGIGVPVAIGISGALILVLNALPFALAATIVVTAVVCVIWTWSGMLLYREYGPALIRALERRTRLSPSDELEATPEDESLAGALLASRDVRTTRLGFDLLSTISSPALGAELAALAPSPRPEIRMSALAGLASLGDEPARLQLAEEVRAATGSSDAVVRLQAARALETLDPADRAAAADLLSDEDRAVRCAALDSVQAGDGFALAPVLAALEDARYADAAAGAVGRLGDAVVPSLAELLDNAGLPAPVLALRLVRAATTASPERDRVLGRRFGHPDRELGLVVIVRLVAAEPALPDVAGPLDEALADDVRHAARILAVAAAIEGDGDELRPSDIPLQRAIADEFDLMRARVRANRLARHGWTRLGPALVELGAGGSRDALAVEALGVVMSPDESKRVLPLFTPGLAASERLRQLPEQAAIAAGTSDVAGWLQDLIEDADGHWSSAWLRACAIHAARGRGALDRMRLDAARALGDPIVDEALDELPRDRSARPDR